MTIVNNSSKTVTTSISSQNCMYDNGDDGSNLSFFNNLTITASTTQPSSGQGQYIEAKASGSCDFEDSTFALVVSGLDTSDDTLNFTDSDESWSCSGQPDNIEVFITNGEQASISITLADPT